MKTELKPNRNRTEKFGSGMGFQDLETETEPNRNRTFTFGLGLGLVIFTPTETENTHTFYHLSSLTLKQGLKSQKWVFKIEAWPKVTKVSLLQQARGIH